MTTLTLAELCNGYGQKKPRKEYVRYERTITTVVDPVELIVNLHRVADALKGDPVWASSIDERMPETFKQKKYNGALATIQDEKPIFMPWLNFKYGRTHVTDGRHRLYALMDEGYTHAKVVCDPWHASMIRTLIDKADGGPEDSGYIEYMAQQESSQR
jgi:hypothetical protein